MVYNPNDNEFINDGGAAKKLTIVNGRLRVNGCGGALVLSPRPGGNNPCCCDKCDVAPTISESGLLDSEGYGWSIKDPEELPTRLPITMSFKFEDSQNCGGQNAGTQSGSVSACFFLNAETEIEVEVSGSVELQNAGYDISTASAGGASATIGSFGEGKGCEMRDTSNKNSATLPAGQHTFTFSTSTNDGLYHKGMTHTFKISKK